MAKRLVGWQDLELCKRNWDDDDDDVMLEPAAALQLVWLLHDKQETLSGILLLFAQSVTTLLLWKIHRVFCFFSHWFISLVVEESIEDE